MDIATLGIAVDTTDLQDGKADLKAFASQGEDTARRIRASTTDISTGMGKAGSAARKMSAAMSGGGMRNTALQLSQVAQQATATGNVVQALAIQLPDLTLGFGPLGIAAGVAGGVLLNTFAPALLGAGEDALSLEEQLDALSASVNDYSAAIAAAFTPMTELTEQFGGMAESVQETLWLMQQLALQDALTALTASSSGAAEQMERLSTAVTNIAEGQATRWSERMISDLGLTLGQAQSLKAAFDDLGNSTGPDEIAAAAHTVNERLIAIYGNAANIPPELREAAQAAGEVEVAAARIVTETDKVELSLLDAYNAATTLAGGLDNASGVAVVLAGNIATVAQNAWSAASAWAEAKAAMTLDDVTGGGPDAARFDVMNTYTPSGIRRDALIGDVWTNPVSASSGSGGGDGGGGAIADMYQSDLEALQDELRTEQEILDAWYNDNLALLEDRRAAEILGETEHKELLLRLEEEYQSRMLDVTGNGLSAKLGMWSGALSDLETLMSSENESLFKIGKAASIANATVSGYTAAVSAWEKGMAVGGPPVAAAFAAASVAKTGALISSIASTSFSGSSSYSSGNYSSNYSSSAATTSSTSETSSKIYVDINAGDTDSLSITSVQSLMETINEAIADGYTIGGISFT